MARTGRPGLSAELKRELWRRWKAGQSLIEIGRCLGKHAGSVFGVLRAKSGKPVQLDPWQERIVRTVVMLLPRGNCKTSLASALGLQNTVGPEKVPGG
ncbi:MAG: hypothetical protein ABI398_00190 [Devosia sp.]